MNSYDEFYDNATFEASKLFVEMLSKPLKEELGPDISYCFISDQSEETMFFENDEDMLDFLKKESKSNKGYRLYEISQGDLAICLDKDNFCVLYVEDEDMCKTKQLGSIEEMRSKIKLVKQLYDLK